MSVCLDGSTLSALLFNHINGANQYGFLLGEKIEHIEDKISDSQIHTYNVNSYLHVSSFIPWPSQNCIYNRSGVINNDLIQSVISDREQTIVGWYSFRHNTTSRPSLRETTLHNSLIAASSFSGQPQDFIFLLCTSSSSTDMSIHTCSYGFMQRTDRFFQNLPLTLMNLGDTTRKEYRKKSNATLSHSKTISGLLQSSKNNFMRSSGEMEHTVKVNYLELSLNDSLIHIQDEIAESEKALGSLELDVADMRQKLLLLEQEEVEMMFNIEENKRQQELDEQRKINNAKQDAEEQKQLEKLLVNLGVSTNDMPSFIQPEAVMQEGFLERDLQLVSVPVIKPALPVSEEHAFTKNSDNTIDHVTENKYATALDYDQHKICEHQLSTNGAEAVTSKLRNTRTLKSNTTDVFSFVEDELKCSQRTTAKKQQTTQSRPKRNIDTVTHGQSSGNSSSSKGSALDSQDYSWSKNIEVTGVQTTDSTCNNIFHQDTSDGTNETSVSSVLEEVVGHEKSPSNPDICDDRYTVSSSPVF